VVVAQNHCRIWIKTIVNNELLEPLHLAAFAGNIRGRQGVGAEIILDFPTLRARLIGKK
jgi:hypothetical protein